LRYVPAIPSSIDPEAPLAGERAPEDELVAEPIEVAPGLLSDAVHVDLVGVADTRR
jgi:hypothetical protein